MKEIIVILFVFAIISLAMIAIVQGVFIDNWLQVINAFFNVVFILLFVNNKIKSYIR